MKLRLFGRCALICSVAMLAGCGGSQPPIGAPGALPQTPAIATHAERGKSWMLPEASSEDLLYLANLHDVTVYSYPEGKLVGKLKGFYVTDGECVDKAQDVWIDDDGNGRMVEYAHGGTKPLKVLTGYAGVGCAIDPITGNLAVTSNFDKVAIFKDASGTPTIYTDPGITDFFFCDYDDKGNLFLDGSDYNSNEFFALAELPRGSNAFQTITLSHGPATPGGVQWDGKYLAIGDGEKTVYEFAMKGKRGTRVGTTPLGAPAAFVSQFFIDGSSLIAPNQYFGMAGFHSDALLYPYPKGGTPTKNITKAASVPNGAVVSKAL